jgi:hypothetical protein
MSFGRIRLTASVVAVLISGDAVALRAETAAAPGAPHRGSAPGAIAGMALESVACNRVDFIT